MLARNFRYAALAAFGFVFVSLQAQQRPLTNEDVIRMVKDTVPESAIIESIRSRTGRFDLSNAARANLLAVAGKSRFPEMTRIWNAMIAKTTNGRGGDDDGSSSTRKGNQ